MPWISVLLAVMTSFGMVLWKPKFCIG